jgi:type I restriction enzyme S subunit
MKHWQIKPLGEVTTCLDSQRIPVKEDDRQKRLGSVPYYGANGQVGWIDKAIFNEPLLLVAEDGGYFDQPERGVAYTIRGPSWVNNHAHILRPDKSQFLLDFLGYYFRHFDFLPYVTGTTRAKLTQRDLMRVEVPVPPLAVQERIVKLLDEADELRKLRVEADRRTATLISSLFHEIFGDPLSNPKGWKELSLSEAAERIVDCPHSTPNWQPVGVVCIRTSNLGVGSWNWEDRRLVSEAEYLERTRRSELLAGDIVLSREGTVGIAAIVPDGLRLSLGQRLVQIRPNTAKMDSEFLLRVLLEELAPANIERKMAGSTSKHFNVGQLRALEVIAPPLELQKQFAQRVTEIRELEADQAASRQLLDDLFQSMLHRAFSGEL